MGKDPVVDDYGGSTYGSRRRNKRAGQLSFRCVDCGKYRFVTRRALSRASRVSCTVCGGPVVETAATTKKIMPSAAKKNYKGRPAVARHCRECGIPIQDNDGMVSHFTIKPECLDAYADSVIEADCVWFRYFDRLTPNGSQGEFMQSLKMVVPATIIIEKTDRVARAKWSAKAHILEAGSFQWREIFAAGNRTEVRRWINNNFGPVELAR